jgi:N-acetylmuramoyl-L-alanine amidase
MRKTLVAGLLLCIGQWAWSAPPPPDSPSGGVENGLWGNITIQSQVTLKLQVRGQKFNLPGYATSLGDEFMVEADRAELRRIATLFGATMQWDDDHQSLRCTHKGVTRWLKLDARKVDGPSSVPGAQETELPLAAQLIDDRPHVPLSALENLLDTRVTVKPNQMVFIEPLLRSVRFEGSSRSPKLIIESTAPVSYKAFTLKNPDRYVIDVAGAVIDTPNLTVQHPDLGNVRLGQFELGPAISRIVIPTQDGVQIKSETWGAREQLSWQMQLPKHLAHPDQVAIEDVRLEKTEKGHRLILSADESMRFEWQRMAGENPRWFLDIPKATLKSPKQDFEIEGKFKGRIRLSQNQPLPNPVVRVVVDQDQAVEVNAGVGENSKQLVIEILDKELDASLAVAKGKGSTLQAALTGTGLIVIDAGHGGSDSGAVNRQVGTTEAAVTLDIARRLAQILKAQGWNVVMTRTSDVDVSYAGSGDREELGARVKVANEAKADLFVSIHCNASVNPSSNGTSIHYYKQSDYVLASQLQPSLMAGTGRNNRGLQANRFYVLAHTQMPAVLVETAFLTNPTEGALLADANYRQKIAESLALGLRQYATTQQLNLSTANK